MAAYNDPTVLHSAECRSCGHIVRDADTLDDGECFRCVEEREPEEEDQ